MLIVFFESLVKSLELKSGDDIRFTKTLSRVYFSRFLEEHKNLSETADQERNNQLKHVMSLNLPLVLLWGGRNVGGMESPESDPNLTREMGELARQE